jgi:hypothetical protein
LTPVFGLSSMTVPRTRPLPRKYTVSIGAGFGRGAGAGSATLAAGASRGVETVPSAYSIFVSSSAGYAWTVPSRSLIFTAVGLSSMTVPRARPPPRK